MMMKKTNRTPLFLGLAISALGLAGCEQKPPPIAPEPAASDEPAEAVSIFRPEAEVDREAIPMAPLEQAISFAESGSTLTDKARADLDSIVASPQMQTSGAIILRGHTDSAGNDEANLRSSRKRAEAVRDYLVEKGVDEARITVIALGEMRPVAPNANLDGTADEAGRAANRRVDVTIEVPGQSEASVAKGDEQPEPDAQKAGTLVEAITGN